MEDLILELFKKAKRPLHFMEIAQRLGLEKKQLKALKKALRNLKKKHLLQVVKGRYVLASEPIVKGTVIAFPAGFGFLHVGEGQKDIYIPPFEMQKLFSGDVIKAKVVEYKGKKEVRVLKILKRAKKDIVCKIEGMYAIPVDENSFHKIVLVKKDRNKLKDGTYVVVEIISYPSKGNPAIGRIKEVLGHPSERSLIVELLIRKYELPTDYPPAVKKEAESLTILIKEDRRDLRDQVCFTIDPERARDFDDAVAIEKIDQERFRLWVHIADVTYFVKLGSEIDKEAYRRGFTFYLPDRALHMLPERLSADLCSLKPNEDRLAFTCQMTFDLKGRLLDYDLYESVIKSKARLTYNEALSLIVGDPALENKYPGFVEHLRLMEDLYRILSKKRWELGSIDFDLPEVELIVDEYGEPTAIIPYERHVAHRIIEQFMVSANETVAMHLENAGYPCLYRVHEKPDPEKVENLLEILNGLGYKTKGFSLEPRFFQKIIEYFEGRPEENLVRFLTLRSMKRAVYSPHNLGHFGLASEHYAHFTSPIRRYPDIVVHRLLKDSLMGREPTYDIEELEQMGQYLSMREWLAEEVERTAIDLLKARYMKAHVGEVFEGIITGLIPAGFFVEIKEYLVEGLVKISDLTDDEYIYDEPAHRFVGVRTGKVYRLGDVVRVKVVAVDEERGKLELVLV
ncbi:ribonuclease R [Thermocrinis minervae]|uniref:Ribonuclease R n=1 Tax=Thermocrinis minervae TaxID=381751 RepID=A0A1M6T1N8_9AQUI|nr:ribonuclease R [Thermocrinis minervae]SHK50819.1 ribonuclease R [Thermocrinis minervae]